MSDKRIEVGSRVKVEDVTINDVKYELSEGTYCGPMHRGPEAGKHMVRIDGVIMYIPIERIRVYYDESRQ